MSRILTGTIIGLAVAAAVAGILWWAGMLTIGPSMAGHEMAAGAEGGESMDMPAGGGSMPGMAMGGMNMAPPPAPDAGSDMPPEAVMISPERQQLIGVRTAQVVAEDITRTVRTVGKVVYDETRVAHIHTKVKGWIEQLYVDFTGKLVEKGTALLGVYSPELVSTQEEYLLALRAQDSLGASPYKEVSATTRSLLDATRRRLLLFDVTAEQIAELEQRREPSTILTLYSPIAGYVIKKNAYEGLYVEPNSELYAIADLTEIWVTADIYESELPFVHVGQRATVTLSYLPGKTFRGVIDYVYPYLAGETRTATVRVVLPNPDITLKPDMFANVELRANLGRSLVVPEDAVIDTGERQVVFLVLEEGHFLPREVTIGNRFDGKLQILDGLEAGDTVASGAAFLIDSETKLRSALRGMTGHQH